MDIDSDLVLFVVCRYNFYIFPQQEIPGSGSSPEFLCQTSSMEFLAKYEFDFNMCIREGLYHHLVFFRARCLDLGCSSLLFLLNSLNHD